MNKFITIKMPKESLRQWLNALRSGKYSQGKNRLKTEDGRYCCLGVLEHCLTGTVESLSTDSSRAFGLPSTAWLREHNIKFADSYGANFGHNQSPYLPALYKSAFAANDCGAHGFDQIADAIEACAEGV